MRRSRGSIVGLTLVLGGAAAWLWRPDVPRRAARGLGRIAGVLGDARRSQRAFSMPSAGSYDIGARIFLAGLYRAVAADLGPFSGTEEILDIGAGPGHLAVELASRHSGVRVAGVDPDPEMSALAAGRAAEAGVGDRVRLVPGTAEALPFPDQSFDVVTSTLSLHHWDDADQGLKEVRRVLRPEGRAVIYDVPAWIARLEHEHTGFEQAVARAPFERRELRGFSWPGPLRILRRATLA